MCACVCVERCVCSSVYGANSLPLSLSPSLPFSPSLPPSLPLFLSRKAACVVDGRLLRGSITTGGIAGRLMTESAMRTLTLDGFLFRSFAEPEVGRRIHLIYALNTPLQAPGRMERAYSNTNIGLYTLSSSFLQAPGRMDGATALCGI